MLQNRKIWTDYGVGISDPEVEMTKVIKLTLYFIRGHMLYICIEEQQVIKKSDKDIWHLFKKSGFYLFCILCPCCVQHILYISRFS